ncbi:MAG: hypothetical protein ACRD2A_12845 [Vicinamibacterales bacterium]
MRAEMTIDDAVNVVNVANDCLAHDADDDVRELAMPAKRLVRQSMSYHSNSSSIPTVWE